jgi:nanoRNase/pAp phosphatase (c-di-AMP/oligoRNAs hydrolase)
MANKYNYIIYHRNCFDGFTGLIVLLKSGSVEKNPFLYKVEPSSTTIPPNINGKNVICIDVAYKAAVVKEIAKRANILLFIDHHVSTRDEIQNLNLQPPHKILYDQTKCAAAIAWGHFFDHKLPLFIKYVEDNDTGRWVYKHTLAFIASLEVLYTMNTSYSNIREWNGLFDKDTVYDLIKQGTKYLEYKNHLINKNSNYYSLEKFPSKKIVSLYPRFKKPGEYKVAVVNGACPDVSLIGHKIAEEIDCDFVLLWNLNLSNKKYICSLRSNKADVGEIANILGGGGHKFASAFTLSSTSHNIQDLFFKDSLPRR